MKQSVWEIQEAKKKLSEVIEHALHQDPQVITQRGAETVIVVSAQEYRQLLVNQIKLSDFFRQSPLAGVALNLERRKDGSRER